MGPPPACYDPDSALATTIDDQLSKALAASLNDQHGVFATGAAARAAPAAAAAARGGGGAGEDEGSDDDEEGEEDTAEERSLSLAFLKLGIGDMLNQVRGDAASSLLYRLALPADAKQVLTPLSPEAEQGLRAATVALLLRIREKLECVEWFCL